MFGPFRKNEPSPLDPAITRIISDMVVEGPESEDYPKLLSYLERLSDVQAKNRKSPISPDTILMVAGNLLGILIIVGYEHEHVMVSKAKDFILKPKNP